MSGPGWSFGGRRRFGWGRPSPSIAALTSQAHRASPISVGERIGRIEKARRLMSQGGMDALMLTGGTSLIYFTDIQWGLSERLFSVVIPVRGQAFLVCPAFEEDRAREQLHGGPLEDTEVLTWHEHESPYALVAGGLRSQRPGDRASRHRGDGSFRLQRRGGPGGSGPVAHQRRPPSRPGVRGVKDEHELALMQLANEVTLTAYKAAYEALEPGMTQGDFRNLVSLAHSQQGFSGGAGVQVGQYSALPHGSVTPQVIEEGSRPPHRRGLWCRGLPVRHQPDLPGG